MDTDRRISLTPEARTSYRTVSLILAVIALGLVIVQKANQDAFHGGNYALNLNLLWIGLSIIFVPVAMRVVMREVSRVERLGLVVLLGVALYVVKIQGSPTSFTLIDEYIHLRNTQNILRTHGLFGYNPLLPASAYYPGLAGVSAALVSVTGLNTFIAGLLVIGAGRILISGCFFLVSEKVTGSARAAGVAGLIYAANPMFLYWSSSFSYEDLGLPLAFFVVWWISRTRRGGNRWAQLVTVSALAAVTFTHHISAFALSLLLVAWFAVEFFTRKADRGTLQVGLYAALIGTASVVWFLLVARPAAAYIFDQNVLPALEQIKTLVAGGRATRKLFSGGESPPSWYMLAGFAALGVIMLGFPLAAVRGWVAFGFRRIADVVRERPSTAVAVLMAASFPFTMIPRLTSDGGALSSRTSEYIYTGIGCLLGLLATEPRWSASLSVGKIARSIYSLMSGRRGNFLIAGMLFIAFIGNITIGNSYFQLLPPPLKPSGYPWIVQPDVIGAAEWAHAHLGPYEPFATDYTDSLALATYGSENPEPEEKIFPIFFDSGLDGVTAQLIRTAKVRYILVDWRMTYGLPMNPGDYYFSQWEPNASNYTTPFKAADLEKFSNYTCSHMLYKNGPIEIFDVTGIERGTCVPKLVAATRQGGSQ